jgi:mycothiol system anti-sigma-R factor
VNPECDDHCQEALDQLERYLDGELPEGSLEEIKRHLTACYPCTDRLTFEEQLRALVRQQCVDRAPERLVTRIRARLEAGDLTS